MTNPNWANRQKMADLVSGWKPGDKHRSPSYINELEKKGRAFRAPDRDFWLIAETLAANADATDPSKQGVSDRHAAARAANTNPPPEYARPPTPPGPPPPPTSQTPKPSAATINKPAPSKKNSSPWKPSAPTR